MPKNTAKRKYITAVCGGINLDVVTVTNQWAKEGQTLEATSIKQLPGGKGANTAVAIHRLSHLELCLDEQGKIEPQSAFEEFDLSVLMIGSVGEDGDGKTMRESLKKNYVNIDGVRTVDGETTGKASITVLSQNGQNTILAVPGANHAFVSEELRSTKCFGEVLPDLVIINLELQRKAVVDLAKTTKAAKIDIILRASPAQWLDEEVFKDLTHLIMNASEAATLATCDIPSDNNCWNAITDKFLAMHVKYVVITLGEDGVFCSCRPGKGKRFLANKIDDSMMKDTTGAG